MNQIINEFLALSPVTQFALALVFIVLVGLWVTK